MKSSSFPFTGQALPVLSDQLVSLRHTRTVLNVLRDGLYDAYNDDIADIWAELGVLALDAELPHFDRAIAELSRITQSPQEDTL